MLGRCLVAVWTARINTYRWGDRADWVEMYRWCATSLGTRFGARFPYRNTLNRGRGVT